MSKYSAKIPPIKVNKQRRIPTGYVIGRLSAGHGDEELLPISYFVTPQYVAATSVQVGGNAAGDLAGTYPAPTVVGLQTRPLANTAPTNGQAIVWNASALQWQPGLPQEFTSFIIVDSTHYYVAMAASFADPEFVYSGGIPVYVLNPGFTP